MIGGCYRDQQSRPPLSCIGGAVPLKLQGRLGWLKLALDGVVRFSVPCRVCAWLFLFRCWPFSAVPLVALLLPFLATVQLQLWQSCGYSCQPFGWRRGSGGAGPTMPYFCVGLACRTWLLQIPGHLLHPLIQNHPSCMIRHLKCYRGLRLHLSSFHGRSQSEWE